MKKIIFMLMTVSLMFTSCDSETSAPETAGQQEHVATASKTSQGLAELRAKALKDINLGGKVFYDSKRGVIYDTKMKSNIVIPPFSIKTKDGKDITGDIEIDYIEIFTKGKMAVANKPTMGQISSQSKGLLETGGEFYLDIRYNGQQVDIVSPIKVNIDVNKSQANPVGMVLWNGGINGNDDLTWNPANTNDLAFEIDGGVFGGKGGNIYDVLVKNSSNFGWCNIDRLSNWPGTKTPITVKPPTGFNHTNSSVYLAIEGEDNMLAQFDMYDSVNNVFKEHYGLVPVGLNCHIIFVGEQNGNYVYSILSVSIGNNATYTITNSSLISTTSYSQVESAISALP